MAELALDRLTLRFGGLTVLDGVSLAVEAGELFALIGPNGAGKTSVLNCVSGIYYGEGAIRVRGNDISGRAPHEIARLGLVGIWHRIQSYFLLWPFKHRSASGSHR